MICAIILFQYCNFDGFPYVQFRPQRFFLMYQISSILAGYYFGGSSNIRFETQIDFWQKITFDAFIGYVGVGKS